MYRIEPVRSGPNPASNRHYIDAAVIFPLLNARSVYEIPYDGLLPEGKHAPSETTLISRPPSPLMLGDAMWQMLRDIESDYLFNTENSHERRSSLLQPSIPPLHTDLFTKGIDTCLVYVQSDYDAKIRVIALPRVKEAVTRSTQYTYPTRPETDMIDTRKVVWMAADSSEHLQRVIKRKGGAFVILPVYEEFAKFILSNSELYEEDAKKVGYYLGSSIFRIAGWNTNGWLIQAPFGDGRLFTLSHSNTLVSCNYPRWLRFNQEKINSPVYVGHPYVTSL